MGRTALPYFRSVHTNRVQSPMWPLVVFSCEKQLVLANSLQDGNANRYQKGVPRKN